MTALIVILHILVLHLCNAFSCSSNNNCSRCDEKSGYCVECTPGMFGQKCERRCNPNCKHDTCLFIAGIDVCKEGCKAGFYGRRCSVPCRPPPRMCIKCHRGCNNGFCLDNHSCISGCHDSHIGSNCFNCSHSCKECNHVSGACKECIPDFGGPDCSVSCKNCSGSCNLGGCDKGCKPGYYGAFCNKVCDANCVDGCEQGNGNCNHCQERRYGPFCKSRCGMGCVNETCTLNGHCSHGCKDGYFGRNCGFSCQEVCMKNRCKGETGLFCHQACNDCGQLCRHKLGYNCSETCLYTVRARKCVDLTTITIDTLEEKAENSLVVYLAVSVTGLLVMIVALFIYFSCRFQRMRRFMYGSVRMPTIHFTHPVQSVDQSVPNNAHEYDEVEDSFISVDLTNPIIAEVFGNGCVTSSKSTSCPRMTNYSTIYDVNAEGKYLTPQADPLQRPLYRHSV